MRNPMLAAALLTPVIVNAGTIELEAGAYWQVQDASTYETLCEGVIANCDVVPGVYNVINLDSGERREGVVVALENQVAYRVPEVVQKICEFRDIDENSVDVFGTSDYYGTVSCEISCPAGKTLMGVRECVLYTDQVASDFLEPAIIPSVFNTFGNQGSCRSLESIHVNDPYRLEFMSVEVSCL